MNFSDYCVADAEEMDHTTLLINVVKDGEMVGSGVIHGRYGMDWQMDDLLCRTLSEAFDCEIDHVEHQSRCWSNFLDDHPHCYKGRHSGPEIRYKEAEGNGKWQFLDDSWTVYITEYPNKQAFEKAQVDVELARAKRLGMFKDNLLKTAGLQGHEKAEKVWEKAVDKHGTQNPQQLESIWNYVTDVVDLVD